MFRKSWLQILALKLTILIEVVQCPTVPQGKFWDQGYRLIDGGIVL